MQLIYKILPSKMWQDALLSGEFSGSPMDIADGFIHFSSYDQVFETARQHFNTPDDLLIFAMDCSFLGDALKWETSRGGASFPHYYGVISPKSIYFIKPLQFDDNGKHIFPDLINA
jgi:uncharacterized protein (DUF952 family)